MMVKSYSFARIPVIFAMTIIIFAFYLATCYYSKIILIIIIVIKQQKLFIFTIAKRSSENIKVDIVIAM